MKAIIILSITLLTNLLVSQQSLDTIYANDKMNVALFFPEPIRQELTEHPILFLPTTEKKNNILVC